MLNSLFQLLSRRPPAGYDRGFIQEVNVARPALPRSRRVGRLLLAGWVLIAVKSWVIIWAVKKFHVPVDPQWVIVPTVIFGIVCTLVYFRGE
jgi:hypothetical protein